MEKCLAHYTEKLRVKKSSERKEINSGIRFEKDGPKRTIVKGL